LPLKLELPLIANELRKLTFNNPPTSCHDPGQCTVAKALERLYPGHEKLLPFRNRPRPGHSRAPG
jgi:hypothetical protein